MSEFDDLIRERLNPKVLAADALPEIELHGGPKDGHRSYVHAPVQHELRIPAVTGIAALFEPTATHVYHLDYMNGCPSLDDTGAYQYTYVRTEAIIAAPEGTKQ